MPVCKFELLKGGGVSTNLFLLFWFSYCHCVEIMKFTKPIEEDIIYVVEMWWLWKIVLNSFEINGIGINLVLQIVRVLHWNTENTTV